MQVDFLMAAHISKVQCLVLVQLWGNRSCSLSAFRDAIFAFVSVSIQSVLIRFVIATIYCCCRAPQNVWPCLYLAQWAEVVGLLSARWGELTELLGASRCGLNTVWGEKASTGTWLLEHSWVERSPEAALLCHVFTLRFGSGFEGISEPWEALRVVLGLCICVLLIHYGIQKAKVKLGQRNNN